MGISMLTDTRIKALKPVPGKKITKVADRDGLYVAVLASGAKSFRFDYKFNGVGQTLTFGQYGESGISLAEARDLLVEARRKLRDGVNPAKSKSEGRREKAESETFSSFTDIWLRDAGLADSTIAMRKHILDRDILPVFGRRQLGDIQPAEVMALCDAIKARGAPATAVHAREIVQQVYRHASARGIRIKNPAEAIKASAIATFKPRDRSLSPGEIGVFFRVVGTVSTLPTIRLALKFILLTMCRKGEFLAATWSEIDFAACTWTIPAERMKARRPHVVYLSQQALDILVALKTCAGGSPYLLPGRYDTESTMSDATLNRVITSAVANAKKSGFALDDFSVHDLRRTASTLLHEAGFNSDWIEKCLAHEQKGVRAVYNKAEYASQRREMLQAWADMVDGWVGEGMSTARKSA